MKILYAFLLLILLTGCQVSDQEKPSDIRLSGTVASDITTLKLGSDTIGIVNGLFDFTTHIEKEKYAYFHINDKAHILFLRPNTSLSFNISSEVIEFEDDLLNSFLMNRDSILPVYTANWNMEEDTFRATWSGEFDHNMKIIDTYFLGSHVDKRLVQEVKDMEYLKRAHITSNFVSFKRRKEIQLDDSIYDFLEGINFHNERLAFHINNRNFQYFYALGKVPNNTTDSLYPFVAMDTIQKHIKLPGIKDMVIKSVVERGLNTTAVDHHRLLKRYTSEISHFDETTDPVLKTYQRIQALQVGKSAPSFGKMLSSNGDSISMKDLSQTPILIYVWGSWCPYCKQELPPLKKLAATFGSRFTLVSVSLDTDDDKWLDYIDENSLSGIHLKSSGRYSEFEQNYLINGTNMYYLIGADRTIRMKNTMKPSAPEFEELLASLE